MKKILQVIGLSVAVVTGMFLLLAMASNAASVESNARAQTTIDFLREKYKEDPDGTIAEIYNVYGEAMYENGILKPEYVDFIRTITLETEEEL